MSVKEKDRRSRKKIRIRKKIFGTAENPRMTVFRSLSQIYVQLVDDTTGKTLVSTSSLSKEISGDIVKAKSKIEKSKIVGIYIAKKATEKNIKTAVFDRSGYAYHGRVKALAEGAREGGIKI